MKKLGTLFIILFMLVGCSNQNYTKSFETALKQPGALTTNHKKKLYSYYVPPHVGIKKSDVNSTIFMVEGKDVLMNLKVDRIVSENFDYDLDVKVEINKNPSLVQEAHYMDMQNKTKKMQLRIYLLDSGNHAIFLNNDEVEMVSVVDKTSLSITIFSMVNILRTVVVNKPEVIAAYSSKEISTYDATYSEFFEQTPPETGTIKEMYDRLNPNRD